MTAAPTPIEQLKLTDVNSWNQDQHLAHDLYQFFCVPVHWRVFRELVAERSSPLAPAKAAPPNIVSFFSHGDPAADTALPVFDKVSGGGDAEPVFELRRERANERQTLPDRTNKAINMISLNLLNFLCTNYCSLVCVNYSLRQYHDLEDLFLPESEFVARADAQAVVASDATFVLKSEYEARLEVYCKRHFDPYAREPNVRIGSVVSSLKQLNYLRWAIQHRVIHYACHHRAEIASYKYCLHRNPKSRRDEPVKLIKKKYTRKRSESIVEYFNDMRAKRDQVQYLFFS